ncbi:2Fe-2S iron-sulfur cluster-binding protein [Actinomarinicola tropica]|uniref:2Fe-2S iron-sulfur cluster binding domain-containing protein n=1 Tax=Actinomarinicola tropica TaxID=2789776 RepID=A0A5Q2RL29_9ACTN|nr:2Fe-2S iron-sulfur cluster-binding protein [Actinomarinicola tropica]QGG96543.1 2Fe-2S iron-sulfur cluster binding domain-containing protein [Actinomarinicola tropica]
MIQFEVDGRQVEVPDDGASLLEVLRDRLGIHSPKDGCSPQGQCGCCTVLVDGQPRVACVTPARRVTGRTITTLDGMDAERRERWGEAFCATGGSQCGFCTPGIIVRLDGLHRAKPDAGVPEVERALQAHLCRCTGWRTILDAWDVATGRPSVAADVLRHERDLDDAARRAEIEGHGPQRVAPDVAVGAGGFAADTAPAGALVAVPRPEGGWAVGETLSEARAASGKVQGRRTTVTPEPPLELPPGEWAVTLRTSWVEPAYLETDASWCEPGGEPASPLANGGAFGGKVDSLVRAAARQLADEHGRPVVVHLSREDAVRLGPKRPPIAAGVRADGSGVVRVVRTPGIAERIRAVLPDVEVEEVDVAGPATSVDLRAAGWAEAWALRAALADGPVEVTTPDGAVASAEVVDGRLAVRVRCGQVLDDVVLRSYCVGAAHMALSWVTSEGLVVDGEGTIHDLTIRSFGVLRAVDTPPIEVEIEASDGPAVNGSDAVFAAVAGAVWCAQGRPEVWPTGQTVRQP